MYLFLSLYQIAIAMQLALFEKRKKSTNKLTMWWVTVGEIDTDVVCVAVW